ncbi:MAG: phosphate ABC transporter permease PstA [Cyanobacteriota bacterium]
MDNTHNNLQPQAGAFERRNLTFDARLTRNLWNTLMTGLVALAAIVAVLPLVMVLAYVLVKGGQLISVKLFTELPPAPGMGNVGGIGNAILGTFLVTTIAACLAIPVGVGGGIYLAEFSQGGRFAKALKQFVRFGTNVLSGVPSIICGVFIYALIVKTRVVFGQSYSGLAGGMALAILMLPTIIKTTDEGLKLVHDELRWGAIGVGASKFTTVIRITLPAAFTPIATGVVLGIARAAGETAPLIFTALFSSYWPWPDTILSSDTSLLDRLAMVKDPLLNPIASLSVLIYNFATTPYPELQSLAWAASFILVIMILGANLIARWLARFAAR